MNVAKLFDELVMIANVEIVIALLPEMVEGLPTQAKRGLEWGTPFILGINVNSI